MIRVGLECGQRFFDLHAWWCKYDFHSYDSHNGRIKRCHNYRKIVVRRIPRGFAIGPVMVIRGKW